MIYVKIIGCVALYVLGVFTPKLLTKLADWYIAKTSVKVATTTSETTKTK
jgi:hypothetical protein